MGKIASLYDLDPPRPPQLPLQCCDCIHHSQCRVAIPSTHKEGALLVRGEKPYSNPLNVFNLLPSLRQGQQPRAPPSAYASHIAAVSVAAIEPLLFSGEGEDHPQYIECEENGPIDAREVLGITIDRSEEDKS